MTLIKKDSFIRWWMVLLVKRMIISVTSFKGTLNKGLIVSSLLTFHLTCLVANWMLVKSFVSWFPLLLQQEDLSMQTALAGKLNTTIGKCSCNLERKKRSKPKQAFSWSSFIVTHFYPTISSWCTTFPFFCTEQHATFHFGKCCLYKYMPKHFILH